MTLSENAINAVAIFTAVVALAGVIVTAVVSLSIARRSTYLSTVTVERSKWIEKLRNNISRLISRLHTVDYELYRDDEFAEAERFTQMSGEIVEAMALVRLQLNPEGRIDANILALLTAIQDHVGGQEYKNLERIFVRHVQWMLKEEWEKVKYEALGPIGRLWAVYKRHQRATAYGKYCAGPGSITAWTRNSI